VPESSGAGSRIVILTDSNLVGVRAAWNPVVEWLPLPAGVAATRVVSAGTSTQGDTYNGIDGDDVVDSGDEVASEFLVPSGYHAVGLWGRGLPAKALYDYAFVLACPDTGSIEIQKTVDGTPASGQTWRFGITSANCIVNASSAAVIGAGGTARVDGLLLYDEDGDAFEYVVSETATSGWEADIAANGRAVPAAQPDALATVAVVNRQLATQPGTGS